MSDWGHDELLIDLRHHKNIAFINAPLGNKTMKPKTQVADMVDILRSFKGFCLSIYEIKASRADYLSDIRSGKWRGYLRHCHRFYFATPKGLIDKSEIPEGMGLFVRNENGWYSLKAADKREVEIPVETLMSLLFLRRQRHE